MVFPPHGAGRTDVKEWAAEKEEQGRHGKGLFKFLLTQKPRRGSPRPLLVGGYGCVILTGTMVVPPPAGPDRILLSVPGLVGVKLCPSLVTVVASSNFLYHNKRGLQERKDVYVHI